MPIVRIELYPGRFPQQKAQAAEAVTRALCETLGVLPSAVEVMFFEVKKTDWATGGEMAEIPIVAGDETLAYPK